MIVNRQIVKLTEENLQFIGGKRSHPSIQSFIDNYSEKVFHFN